MLVALVGVAVFAVLGRSAQSQTPLRRRSLRGRALPPGGEVEDRLHGRCAQHASPEGRDHWQAEVYVMNADGSGKRRLRETRGSSGLLPGRLTGRSSLSNGDSIRPNTKDSVGAATSRSTS